MIHGSSSSALQRSRSSGSLASDLSYTTARSQVSPSPLSTGRRSSAASTFSTPSAASRPSAGSRSAAPHLAIEMAGAPTMSASDRLEVSKVRDRLAVQIGALAQSLRADARAGMLIVPAAFAAPPGLVAKLKAVQNDLFVLGSHLATPTGDRGASAIALPPLDTGRRKTRRSLFSAIISWTDAPPSRWRAAGSTISGAKNGFGSIASHSRSAQRLRRA